MIYLAIIISAAVLIINLSLFLRFKPPFSFYFFLIPVAAGAVSPVLAVLGCIGTVLGLIYDCPAAIATGLLGTAISIYFIFSVTTSHGEFETGFGEGWLERIPAHQASFLMKRRWSLGMPKTDQPLLEKDIPFWTIPGSGRELLCDIWQPPAGIQRSGLAVIFLHGSAWYLFDKDYGTRPFFRQLTAQGHVVMDVAYRLCPEVDILGMTGDVKRAVAWLKSNADRYGINPDRIVLGGGSAGGHLALLAAYTPQEQRLSSPDLAGEDLSVRGVFSLYGPIDLAATYHHLAQERFIGQPRMEIGRPDAAGMKKDFSGAGRMDTLLGGHLHEVPEMYELASPISHVSTACPPTLLIQGIPDVITPAVSARELQSKLVACGVPAVNILYPLANHIFDLVLPEISPTAQSALYDIERFLGLLV